jgi:glycosyltransferase involved in cell wall biosynthesis
LKKLSIITINLNNSIGLEKTISSVLNQSFKNFEYIIIDGASHDNSIEIIKKHSCNIYYWVSEKDDGIYNAMNKGLKQASGEYCLFLNSGDHFYSDNALKEIFDYHPTEDILYCNIEIKGNGKSRIHSFPDKLTFYWLFTEFIGHPSTLIKRSLFNTYGYYNENYKIVSDWEFFLLAIAKYQVTCKHYDITFATLYEGGISTNIGSKELVIKERDQVMKEHFKLFYDDYSELYKIKHFNFRKRISRFMKNILFIK